MADDIDRANDQAHYLLDVALQRNVERHQAASVRNFARIATKLSRCFDSRRLQVAKPALTVRGYGRLGDE
jgi:hypothetical protein